MPSAAYLAGLIDGDGCLTIVRRDKGKTKGDRRRKLSFETLVKIAGETQHLRGLRREWSGIGSLYIRKRHGQRHLAEWMICQKQARALLKKITRFLVLKKAQALNILNFPRCKSRWDATPELRAEQYQRWILMKELNSRTGRGTRSYHGRRSS